MKKILFTLCLAAALTGAQGQIYIDSYRFGAPVTDDLILDSFPTAAVAFSLRKLDKDYTGNCLTVRRVNGDTSNIGFSGNFLDTLSLKSFCGETSTDTCWVRTWYDQSGNTRNLRQTTNSKQPRIVTAGIVNRGTDGDVGLRGSGNHDMSIPSSTSSMSFLHKAGNYSLACVFQPGVTADPNNFYALFVTNNYTGSNIGSLLAYDDRASVSRSNGYQHTATKGPPAGQDVVFNNIVNNVNTPNDINLIYIDVSADNATAADRSQIYSNNNTVAKNNTATQTPSTSNSTFDFTVMGVGNSDGTAFDAFFHELIIWSVDRASDRSAIRNNINNFYSIY